MEDLKKAFPKGRSPSKEEILESIAKGYILSLQNLSTPELRERVEIHCINCGQKFETWILVHSGDYDELVCSRKCGIAYYQGIK